MKKRSACMTADEFASRFSLYPSKQLEPDYSGFFKPDAKSKEAAVLVPIVVREDGLKLLFTKRASHLRHHAGQISFPGGRRDDSDSDLIETALRECEEEISLARVSVTPLGWLPSLHTISNYTVFPLVGLIKEIGPVSPNPDEVAEIFEAPLTHFLNRHGHTTAKPKRGKLTQTIHFMPYQDKLIWGATAAILDKLAAHFE